MHLEDAFLQKAIGDLRTQKYGWPQFETDFMPHEKYAYWHQMYYTHHVKDSAMTIGISPQAGWKRMYDQYMSNRFGETKYTNLDALNILNLAYDIAVADAKIRDGTGLKSRMKELCEYLEITGDDCDTLVLLEQVVNEGTILSESAQTVSGDYYPLTLLAFYSRRAIETIVEVESGKKSLDLARYEIYTKLKGDIGEKLYSFLGKTVRLPANGFVDSYLNPPELNLYKVEGTTDLPKEAFEIYDIVTEALSEFSRSKYDISKKMYVKGRWHLRVPTKEGIVSVSITQSTGTAQFFAKSIDSAFEAISKIGQALYRAGLPIDPEEFDIDLDDPVGEVVVINPQPQVIAISGPSGSGKSTTIRNLLKMLPNSKTAPTVTTRQKRASDKKDERIFVSKKEFESELRKGDLIAAKLQKNGNYYGRRLDDFKGADYVIVDVTLSGLKDIKRKFPNTFSVYLEPVEDPAFIRKRLLKRGDMSMQEARKRSEIIPSHIESSKAMDFDLRIQTRQGQFDAPAKEISDMIPRVHGPIANPSKKITSVRIEESPNKEKKMVAYFFDEEGKKVKTTHFGARGMSDFTQHKDPKRMKRYLARHSKMGEDWKDPTTAGALSRWILWGKPSLRESFNDYKKKFRLEGVMTVTNTKMNPPTPHDGDAIITINEVPWGTQIIAECPFDGTKGGVDPWMEDACNHIYPPCGHVLRINPDKPCCCENSEHPPTHPDHYRPNPRIPKKYEGQDPSEHSDLYTDEDPKGTIQGLGFKDKATAEKSVNIIKKSGKTHAHKIQAAMAMEQRARFHPNATKGIEDAQKVYANFIEEMKEKTKAMRNPEDCPPATQSLELNTKNRNKAIQADYIRYGPLNLSDLKYYEDAAAHWKTTVETAKKSKCSNCVAFDISPRMLDCMPGPVSEPIEDEDGYLGYCWMHHFKCHSARTCFTWAAGGPINKDKVSHEWQERAFGTKNPAFIVGKEDNKFDIRVVAPTRDPIMIESLRAATDPSFVHHEWYVKHHLDYVMAIAKAIVKSDEPEDQQLIEDMVWMHDYPKMLGDKENFELVREVVSKHRSKRYTDRLMNQLRWMEEIKSPDWSGGTTTIAAVMSTADALAHYYGPFWQIYMDENEDKDLEFLKKSNAAKLEKDKNKLQAGPMKGALDGVKFQYNGRKVRVVGNEHIAKLIEKKNPKTPGGKTFPKRYLTGLNKEERAIAMKEIDKGYKYDTKDPKAYEYWKSDIKATARGYKTVPSKYKKKFIEMYGPMPKEGDFITKISKATKIKKSIIQKVYDKGLAAWRVGHRPGVQQHQWAAGRVYSFVTLGNTVKKGKRKMGDYKLAVEAGLVKDNPSTKGSEETNGFIVQKYASQDNPDISANMILKHITKKNYIGSGVFGTTFKIPNTDYVLKIQERTDPDYYTKLTKWIHEGAEKPKYPENLTELYRFNWPDNPRIGLPVMAIGGPISKESNYNVVMKNIQGYTIGDFISPTKDKYELKRYSLATQISKTKTHLKNVDEIPQKEWNRLVRDHIRANEMGIASDLHSYNIILDPEKSEVTVFDYEWEYDDQEKMGADIGIFEEVSAIWSLFEIKRAVERTTRARTKRIESGKGKKPLSSARRLSSKKEAAEVTKFLIASYYTLERAYKRFLRAARLAGVPIVGFTRVVARKVDEDISYLDRLQEYIIPHGSVLIKLGVAEEREGRESERDIAALLTNPKEPSADDFFPGNTNVAHPSLISPTISITSLQNPNEWRHGAFAEDDPFEEYF